MTLPLESEWLEPDGLGGYASGTIGGFRTRRYHALLLAATEPPAGRRVLVNGCDAWIETSAGRFGLSAQRYLPDVLEPQGHRWLEDFQYEPWPRWAWRLPDGTRIQHELFVPHERPLVALRWKVLGAATTARLTVRPFLSGRDYHQVQRENDQFSFQAATTAGSVVWRPYAHEPAVRAFSNGAWRASPAWYRNFHYTLERERGLDDVEDLGSPGEFAWQLREPGEALLLLAAEGYPQAAPHGLDATRPLEPQYQALRQIEAGRRAGFASPLDRAAQAYLVRRGAGKTILAGYPWFTDWGRDTFIALRGLCLARGDLSTARDILVPWADTVREGMLPNRFPDEGAPEYNSVDASLWYVLAVHEFLEAAEARGVPLARRDVAALDDAVHKILTGYERGTRFNIHADHDGLLAAGGPGTQLTWMDAKVGDQVFTPRTGKPVEIQALWLNALGLAGRRDARLRSLAERGRASLLRKFWNPTRLALYDVVDVDHRPGVCDASIRPNQVFAIGGLPMALLEGAVARAVIDTVEKLLATPLGLRTLAPGDARYQGRMTGPPLQRDGAYHQGTVWPWLQGAFVEAWVRVRGSTESARREARARFLAPLEAHRAIAGLGHISETADGDPPHAPRGCPWQAWSLAEFLRLERVVLAPPRLA